MFGITVWYYQPTHLRLVGDSAEGKMCVVVPRPLGKGAAARPRCIPQAVALNRYRAAAALLKRCRFNPRFRELDIESGFGLLLALAEIYSNDAQLVDARISRR